MKISSCWIELLIISPLERLKNVFIVQKEFVAWLALANSAAVGNFLQHKSGCCSPYIRLFRAKSLPSGESVTFNCKDFHTNLLTALLLSFFFFFFLSIRIFYLFFQGSFF